MSYRVIFRTDPELQEIVAATLPTYTEARVFADAIAWLAPRIEGPASSTIHLLDERSPASIQPPHRLRVATA